MLFELLVGEDVEAKRGNEQSGEQMHSICHVGRLTLLLDSSQSPELVFEDAALVAVLDSVWEVDGAVVHVVERIVVGGERAAEVKHLIVVAEVDQGLVHHL